MKQKRRIKMKKNSNSRVLEITAEELNSEIDGICAVLDGTEKTNELLVPALLADRAIRHFYGQEQRTVEVRKEYTPSAKKDFNELYDLFEGILEDNNMPDNPQRSEGYDSFGVLIGSDYRLDSDFNTDGTPK
jgi:hypothetical protein